ncbi:tetratricopeptide repeat protein [Corticibacter populi]|uniref:tetratricopeptide repeat protein n=1 Tax=Corticibacter populi TaxID=1550736 RepID=UPI0013C2E201|nr:tetratricopeptide repeat protein [Corticibacter populi]
MTLGAVLLSSGCQASSPLLAATSTTAPQAVVESGQSVEQAVASRALSPRAAAETFYEVLVAELLGQSGDYVSSYELLMRAAQTLGQPDLFERAAEAAFHAQDGQRALRATQAWQQSDPDSRDANKAVLQVLLALNQIPQTQWHLKHELFLMPDDEKAESLYAIPFVYQRAPDKHQVLTVVEAALERELAVGSPWRADALAVVGRLQLQAGDGAKALQTLQEAHALNPQSSGVAFLAMELLAQGQQQVEPILRAYAASEAPTPQFLLAYSRLLIAQQDSQQALLVLDKLTERDAGMPEAWLAKGALHTGLGQFAEAGLALDHFEMLMENVPDTTLKSRAMNESYLLRAQIAEQQNDAVEASRWLDLVDDPAEILRAQLRRASLLAGSGQMDAARALIRSVPADDAETERLKAQAEVQLLRQHGLYQDAYALQSKLVEADPDDDELLYDQAMLAERIGDVPSMERMLRTIIRRSPDFHHASNALGYSYADRGVHLREARRLIEKALQAAPGDPYITDSLAWLEFREGNLPRARELLQQAFGQQPDAEIAAHLGEVLWQLQERDAARAIWAEGLKLNRDNATLRETVQRLGAGELLQQEAP